MSGFDHVVQLLEFALALCLLVVVLGSFGVFRWWMRRPVSSQRDREQMFLAHQAALMHACRDIERRKAVRDAA